MMSKKHKKKKSGHPDFFSDVNRKSKKKLNKEFKKALNEIEDMRICMYESDKADASFRNRKKINKAESVFYTDMKSIKSRKKIAKKWKKTGFLDQMIELLQEISPFVQLLAKALASLITLFLSIPMIKETISPSMLAKVTAVFDLAMAI